MGIIKKLKTDEDLRATWTANIQMSYKDAELHYKKTYNKNEFNLSKEDKNNIAELAANNFIKLLIS